MASVLRRRFVAELLSGLRVVWPILSALLVLMAALGMLVAVLERWALTEGLYFAFVSGLTIGYGDFAPKGALARVLAIAIGLTGVLLAGLIVAIGVNALHAATGTRRHD
jgi:Ion channel